MFSHSDILLSEGHVHALIDGGISIDSKIDPVTKQWSVQDVKIGIRNTDYRQDVTTHLWVKFADEVGSIRGALIDIYVLAGIEPTQLSDGLRVFSGEIDEPAQITRETVTINAVDSARRKNLDLPLRFVSVNAAWTGIPLPGRLRKIPIVYGEYTKAFDDTTDYGLIKCELVSSEAAKKFTCSDHAMHTLSKGFIKQNELPMPAQIVSPTLTADDSGYGTALMVGNADVRLYADNIDTGDFTYSGITLDAGNAGDLLNSTYARTQAHTTGPGGVLMYLGFSDYANNEKNTLTPIGKIIGEDVSGTKYGWLCFRVKKAATLTADSPPEVALLVGNTGGSDVTLDISTFGDDVDVTAKFAITEIANVLWHLRSGDSTYTTDDRPMLFRIIYDGTVSAGQVNNDVLWCRYCYIKYRYKPYYIAAGYVAGKGRKFGAWVDGATRTNSYAEGGLIEDPAFIIESILRDCLGLGDDDIDTASFDAAEDSGVKARIQFNSDSEIDAFSAIRQLAEQSRFAVVITGASKVRLVPLNVSSPTIARILTATDIMSASENALALEYSKDSRIINVVRVKHRWQEEHQAFKERTTLSNYTEFGDDYPVDFQWKNITDASGSILAVGGLIRDTWGVQRTKINIVCQGIANLDLTVGDWIELDPTTVDPYMKCYGASWSGKKFLITRARYTDKQCQFEAINLI